MTLAIEWYKSTPLPDKDGDDGDDGDDRLTELSHRLLATFDNQLFCDIELFCQNELGCPISAGCAHRAVLIRNPKLQLEAGQPVKAPAGVTPNELRMAVRSHYMEWVADRVNCKAGNAQEAASGIESLFGPTSRRSRRFTPLSEALTRWQYTDCAVCLSNGSDVPVHRFVVGGVDDGSYFTAALRWPGATGVIQAPAGLNNDAFGALLRLRYGCEESVAECVLEARHFAELFDWADVLHKCEEQFERLLLNARSLDEESLLNVLCHAEGTSSLPARLRAAALAVAVQQWARFAGAAMSNLPAARHEELRALSHVQKRDGHVFGSLEEYLHAAEDDLSEWERNMTVTAPAHVRKRLEREWMHWRQLVLEHGRISGAAAVERWCSKVRQRRDEFREARIQQAQKHYKLPADKTWFDATLEWREVPSNAVCGSGLEYRCDMQTGRNYARLCL